jgi:hypothetical protein
MAQQNMEEGYPIVLTASRAEANHYDNNFEREIFNLFINVDFFNILKMVNFINKNLKNLFSNKFSLTFGLQNLIKLEKIYFLIINI